MKLAKGPVLLIAAIATSSISALICLVLALMFEPVDQWPLWAMGLTFLVTFGHLVTLGIPITLWLEKIGRLNWVCMPVSGLVAGLVSAGLLGAFTRQGLMNDIARGNSEGITTLGTSLVDISLQQLISLAVMATLGLMVSSLFFAILGKATRWAKS